MKKTVELIESIIIYIALISLLPVLVWWHKGNLPQQKPYLFYLFIILCIMGYITYRRIKRLRSAFKAAKNQSQKPPFPPFFG